VNRLEAINSAQEKVSQLNTLELCSYMCCKCTFQELKSIKAAYNELLSEKEKSVGAIDEVNRLKKELNQAHKVC